MGDTNNIDQSINSFYVDKHSIPNESGDFENKQGILLKVVAHTQLFFQIIALR